MTFLRCPKCNQEVSNNANFCFYCGCPLRSYHNMPSRHESGEINYTSETFSPSTKTVKIDRRHINRKKLIFIMTIVVLFAITLCFKMNMLSDDENYGLKIVEKYKDMLKNPDSLVLRSDVVVISYLRDGEIYRYVFFDSSGENSYGATVTSTPCFVNGEYLCDTDDIPTTMEYMNMGDAEAKKYLGLELALAQWNLYGNDAVEEKDDIIESYAVSAPKIARKQDIEYKVN